MEYSEKEKLDARFIRLGVILNLYRAGFLSEKDALEVLSGPLEPGDSTTTVDDSRFLTMSNEDILSYFSKERRSLNETN